MDRLEDVGQQLAKAILEEKSVEQVVFNVGKVLSYLESEQEKRLRLEKALKDANDRMEALNHTLWGTEDKPGLIQRIHFTDEKVDGILERSDKNGKLLRSIIGSAGAIIILELLRLAMQHMK